MFKQIVSFILLFHFIFYIGCASVMYDGVSYQIEGEEFKEMKNPKHVYFLLKNSDALEGKILSVRKNSILIESSGKISHESKLAHKKYVTEILIEDIGSILLEGESKIGKYSKVGGLVGAIGVTSLWAAAIAHEESKIEDDEFSEGGGLWIIFIPVAFLYFGLLGCVLGFFVGAVFSPSDKELTIKSDESNSILNELAKFPEEEPKIFQELFPQNKTSKKPAMETP